MREQILAVQIFRNVWLHHAAITRIHLYVSIHYSLDVPLKEPCHSYGYAIPNTPS